MGVPSFKKASIYSGLFFGATRLMVSQSQKQTFQLQDQKTAFCNYPILDFKLLSSADNNFCEEVKMKLGYTLIYVDDVEKTMNFYALAFKIKMGFLHDSKEYGEMITGDTKLGFVSHQTARANGFEYEEISLNKKPPGIEIGFLSDNVNESFADAIKAGAISVSEPITKPWGQTVSYVRDCNGLLIEICSPL